MRSLQFMSYSHLFQKGTARCSSACTAFLSSRYLSEMRHPQASYTRGSTLPPLKPGVLRLYSMRFCPYAQKTRLVLAHKCIPYEVINVDLYKKPNWFYEKNPLALVPILEKDGEIVYESDICNEWLEENYKVNNLVPDVNTSIQWKMLRALFSKKVERPLINAAKSLGPKDTVEKGLKWLDDTLGNKSFFAGSSVGMIDFDFWPFIERLDTAAVSSEVLGGNLKAWITRMKALPAVQESLLPQEKHIRFFDQLKRKDELGTIDYDFDLPKEAAQSNL